MRKPQITRVKGGQIDINAPGQQEHKIYEDIHIYQGRRIHVHDGGTEIIDHRDPNPLEIDLDPTRVNIRAGAPQVGYEHGAREQEYRGTLREAPQQYAQRAPALPAPQSQTRGLPAPPRRAPAPAQQALPAPQTRTRAPAQRALPAPSEQPVPMQTAQKPRDRGWASILFPGKDKR